MLDRLQDPLDGRLCLGHAVSGGLDGIRLHGSGIENLSKNRVILEYVLEDGLFGNNSLIQKAQLIFFLLCRLSSYYLLQKFKNMLSVFLFKLCSLIMVS